MRTSMVGTTMALVMRSERAVSIQPSAEKFSSCTMRRPAYTELAIEAIPAMWYGGTLTSVASLSAAPPNSTEPRM